MQYEQGTHSPPPKSKILDGVPCAREWTGREFDTALELYLNWPEDMGGKDAIKEYKETADPVWMYLFTKLEFKKEKVLDLLSKDYVVEPDDEAETEAEFQTEAELKPAEQP